jgi:hypothetical protein
MPIFDLSNLHDTKRKNVKKLNFHIFFKTGFTYWTILDNFKIFWIMMDNL